MEYASRFSERDWTFLAQLPWRIGLWMVHQDDGGGERAYSREMTALHQSLKTCRNKYANLPVIAELLDTAMRGGPVYDQWMNAPQDCSAALRLLKTHVDAPTLNCFRLMMIDVAESVARAAPNGDMKTRNLYKGPQGGWYGAVAAPLRFGRGPKVTKPEKHAINQLIVALEASALVQEWTLEPFAPLSAEADSHA